MSTQDEVLAHIRDQVLATENGEIDSSLGESLVLAADMFGSITFDITKEGTSVDTLDAKWLAHKDDCEVCEGWTLR